MTFTLNTQTQVPYFESFLCWFTGADEDKARSPHTAEALQVQPLLHWDSGHSIVLKKREKKIKTVF